MPLTADQQKAIAARGNVLVMAGAGTGKTSTLVARCLSCLEGPEAATLDRLLVVTFTEAAAAEARARLRAALESLCTGTGVEAWAHQLALFDAAHIGTLHGFCFRLIRQHFYQLGLDPQVTVLDAGEAQILAHEILTEILDQHYAGRARESQAVQELIAAYAGGRDDSIRKLVLQLHHYSQTRPDPRDWLQRQTTRFAAPEPTQWTAWLLDGVAEWRKLWQAQLKAWSGANAKAAECLGLLSRWPERLDRTNLAGGLRDLLQARAGAWPKGNNTERRRQLKDFFEDTEFLAALAPGATPDPLVEDWNWCRQPMLALLGLAGEFSTRFAERKLADGVVDFHDLEQLTLQLLWDVRPGPDRPGQPSAIAAEWRERLKYVFVDEYQDINAAQDQIVVALSGAGPTANRFLVGDVKQSIYRFRLAEPRIFREYARDWIDGAGVSLALARNFRSRPGILEFANSVFSAVMGEEVGGVNYDAAARLVPGLPAAPGETGPEVELAFLFKSGPAGAGADAEELQDSEREARHLAVRLKALADSGRVIFDRDTGTERPLTWRDMAVLLRAPSGKAEGYAKQFAMVGVPLAVARGGFFESLEISDLLNLLRMLDNPLQDIPLLAVLRSPLVGLSLDELAAIRLAAQGRFWTALARADAAQTLPPRAAGFLQRFTRWRRLARHAALSQCLDTILDETHYAEWLRTRDRGGERYDNVQRLLGLARQFDQFQRQGLFRFLQFIEAQNTADAAPESAGASTADAVRLMSIHQSKGLEFPVVAVADLGKSFNLRDLSAEIILDEDYGLCPQVRPPGRGARYPSAAQWLARQRQRRELIGEELRLLYVALTRAREKLLLSGVISEKKWEGAAAQAGLTSRSILTASSAAEWLAMWHFVHGESAQQYYSLRELAAPDEPPPPTPPAPESVSGNGPDLALDAAGVDRLTAVLNWRYPHAAATQRAAKTSVTALRRAAEAELAEEAQPFHRPALRRRKEPAVPRREIGLAHHAFLEHVALDRTTSLAELQAEARRLTAQRVLSETEAGWLDLEALAGFWQSPVGGQIRARADLVERELAFTARFATAEIDRLIRHGSGVAATISVDGEIVIIQGVADLVVLAPGEIWLLDFKTDQVRAAEVADKARHYEPQLKLYARALARIYARPVTAAWLHFLSCGQTVTVSV